MDENQQTVIKLRGSRHKSYLEQFLPPWNYARQYVSNALGNMKKFAKADFQMGYGMKFLIRGFYNSITDNAPVPIPYREIILTAKIMDTIFAQLAQSRQDTSRTTSPWQQDENAPLVGSDASSGQR